MRSAPPTWALALLVLPACASEANYTLQLRPSVPVNEAPFAGGPPVHLRLQDALGNVEWFSLGPLEAGTVEENGFGPLQEHRVGVALGGGGVDDLGGVSAYGEVGPITLGADREELQLDILIAERGGVGTLGSLAQAAFGAGVAVTTAGDLYFFGGTKGIGTPCNSIIHKVSDLDSGDWTSRSLATALPTGVCYPVVQVVEVDGRELIVVSGGETTYGTNNTRVRMTSLFDPETDTVVWQGEGAYSRARDRSMLTSDGRVLFVGSHQTGSAAPVTATWEIFDPSARGFGAGDAATVKPWGFMASPVATGMALCGGATWTGSTVTPTRDCEILAADGSSDPLPSLPIALRDGGMATLADGRLLVAGGIAQTGSAGTNLAAQARAWILDPDEGDWVETRPLDKGRAYFHLVADPSGGAVAIGGVGVGWGFGGVPTAVPDCGERFEPEGEGGDWVRLDPCGAAGAGLLPSIDVHPGRGLLTLQGRMEDGSGGEAFGIVAFGPDR